METERLITLLEGYVGLLKAGSKTDVDVVQPVIDSIIKHVSMGKDFTYYDAYKNQNKIVPVLNMFEISTGINEGKIKAIKAYKDRTFLSLMDSKHAVEKYFSLMGYKFK